MSQQDQDHVLTKRGERRVFIFIAVFLFPILSAILVGGYGFLIWIVQIAQMAGLEVHAQGQGKIVVTAEAGDVRELADLADELAQIESVVNVAPVYHEYAGAGEGVS